LAVEKNNGKINVQISFQVDKFCGYFELLKISPATIAPIEMKILFCKKRLQWKAGNSSLKNNKSAIRRSQKASNKKCKKVYL
jgi:hypothetical protein